MASDTSSSKHLAKLQLYCYLVLACLLHLTANSMRAGAMNNLLTGICPTSMMLKFSVSRLLSTLKNYSRNKKSLLL